MMPKFSIISLFPDMISDASSFGVLGRALDNGQLDLATFNPRDFASDERGSVDDNSYGGGPGMVMQVGPLRGALVAAKSAHNHIDEVIYLSPQGKRIDQQDIFAIASNSHTILLCGRYEGIDQRVIETDVTRELSLGDFVMSGGEFAALAVLDAVSRTLPGVLGNELSAPEDSFYDGLLDHPHYTRPESIDNVSVPEVLLSGDHAAIRRWRRKMALGQTFIKRPDLLNLETLSPQDSDLLNEFRDEMSGNNE